MRAEKYQVLGDLWQSPHVFCVLGYIPAEDAPGLQALLESQYRAFVEVEDPGPDEDLPVKLKNGFSPPRWRAWWRATACPARARWTPPR